MSAQDLVKGRTNYGINESLYLASSPDEAHSHAILHFRTRVMGFSLSHFEAGLRLSVDPFIAELLNATHSAPLDLTYNTMVALVSFIVICLALSCEPTLTKFHDFFSFLLARNRLQARMYNAHPYLITPFKNKYGGWYAKAILVNSFHGWNFRILRSRCAKCFCGKGTTFPGGNEMKAAIAIALGISEPLVDGKG